MAEEESAILWAAWLKAARADGTKLVMDWGGRNQEGEDSISCQIFALRAHLKKFLKNNVPQHVVLSSHIKASILSLVIVRDIIFLFLQMLTFKHKTISLLKY